MDNQSLTANSGSHGDRTPEQITDLVVACLRVVNPKWLAMFPDDSTLTLHVRDTLDDLEQLARKNDGYAATGCMVVTYDHEVGQMSWLIDIATAWDDDGELESGSSLDQSPDDVVR